jgi:cytochrome c-type biogenesis protein CcmH/NrfF
MKQHMSSVLSEKQFLKLSFEILVVAFLLVILIPNASTGEKIPLMKLEEVSDLIMSPGCDYMYTLTNCPSSAADQMRELVKDKLLKGESKEAILTYFEGVYGTKVLARPKKKGFYFIAWWFPYFLLFDVFVLVAAFLYLWRKKAQKRIDELGYAAADAPDDNQNELETALEEEVRKLKEG